MGTSGASVAGRAIGISQPRDFASWVFGLPGCAGASISNRSTADSIILSSSVRVFRLADSRGLDFATDRVSANTPRCAAPDHPHEQFLRRRFRHRQVAFDFRE